MEHLYGMRRRDMPDIIGIVMLSLIGEGMASKSIPIKAAMKPFTGSMNIRVPRKAEARPIRVPSRLFDLLEGRTLLPSFFPKIVADPSPRVRTVMEV